MADRSSLPYLHELRRILLAERNLRTIELNYALGNARDETIGPQAQTYWQHRYEISRAGFYDAELPLYDIDDALAAMQ
jgi:hypothetical protein